MRFIDPRTDFAFKKIFGNAEAKEVLISFIEAVLGLDGDRRLRDVTIADSYQAPRLEGLDRVVNETVTRWHLTATATSDRMPAWRLSANRLLQFSPSRSYG